MKKIKIIHIQVVPKLSGVQLFTLHLLSALPDNLYEKYAVFSSIEEVSEIQKRELVEKFSAAKIKIIWFSSLKRNIGIHDACCFIDFYRLFKDNAFDIVHTNSTKPGIVARVAARVAGIKKIVHTIHGISYHAYIPIPKRVFYYLIEITSSLFGNYNICVNKFYLRFYSWIPLNKALTIYNGVDFNLLQKNREVSKLSSPRSLFSQQTDFRILFVGRLDDQKDPITLLESFKILCENYPIKNINYTLSMVGDGELSQAANKFCIDNSMQSVVKFHGWSTNPVSHYISSDLFVCSSIYEAFGFTFVEAAYFGLPIVASNVEGIPEVVLDGKMGYLVPAKAPALLAEAIYRIASNPEIRSRFSREGTVSVVERFSIETMVSSYRKIYENLNP